MSEMGAHAGGGGGSPRGIARRGALREESVGAAEAQTSTGEALPVVVPSPSWPCELLPQHVTPPEVVTAQVCVPPAEMAMTPVRGRQGPGAAPDGKAFGLERAAVWLEGWQTPTGAVRLVAVPSPTWPSSFHPQHLTLPAAVRAQVW